jgi:hypothetical protein
MKKNKTTRKSQRGLKMKKFRVSTNSKHAVYESFEKVINFVLTSRCKIFSIGLVNEFEQDGFISTVNIKAVLVTKSDFMKSLIEIEKILDCE